MRVTRLRLTSWRNFASLDLALGPRALFFGPGAAGKSNLLDAVRLLGDVARPGGGLRRAIEARGGRHLRSTHGPAGTDFTIELDALVGDEPWGYRLSVALDRAGQPRVRTEAARQGRRRLLRRPEGDDRREASRLTQTHLEQASTAPPLQPLVDLLASVRSFGGPVDRAALLGSVLATPKRTREARLRRVVELARVALPRLDRVAIEHDEAGLPRLLARFDRGKAAAWHPADQLSDGAARLLALLWEATDGAGPLLLDDPESHLHPEVVGRLLDLLAEAAPRGGRQLLIATHAERLVDDGRIAPAEIFLLNPTSQGTHVETAADDTMVHAAVLGDEPLGAAVSARTSPANGDGQMPLRLE
ncbi:MAG: hypothetical protein EOO75_07865 [Myxococcales bacterium]|nr:MAG: hypothetical protein EOO75_07865 [Myxococcales bacterium]